MNMFFNVFILCLCVVLNEAAFEGERCVYDGVPGVCISLNKCQSAIQNLRNRKNPQICSFLKSEPVVCCVDGGVSKNPSKSPSGKSGLPDPVAPRTPPPPESPPPDEDLEDDEEDECAPLSPSLSPPKTGQKAFDKCIEYQEQLIYPCEKGVSILGDLSRGNNCHHNADELIIGGENAAQYEFPHSVLLGYGQSIKELEWLCGGTLISDRFILTAGHCIATRDTPVSFLLIGALNRSEAADTSKIYKVKNIFKHPKYQPPIRYHDIALLEVEKPVPLNQFTVPACIHTGDPVNDTEVLATGWGHTQDKVYSLAETLQRVILKKFPSRQCLQKYPPGLRLMKQGLDEETQICYGDTLVAKDTCPGDSGGPIQIKSTKIYCTYTVVGVTSIGIGCGNKNLPGVYTRVSNYVNWIENIVWPN